MRQSTMPKNAVSSPITIMLVVSAPVCGSVAGVGATLAPTVAVAGGTGVGEGGPYGPMDMIIWR